MHTCMLYCCKSQPLPPTVCLYSFFAEKYRRFYAVYAKPCANCTLYKIIHGYFYFPPNVFVPQVSRCNSSLPLLYQPLARTNAFHSSFVLSSVFVWNQLPHEALTAHSIVLVISITGYILALAFSYLCISALLLNYYIKK